MSLKINKEYFSKISKELLFKAWVSEEMVIEPISRIKSNTVVGGEYVLFIDSPEGTVKMSGEFKEIIDNEKIVCTWWWEGSEEKTIITVKFENDEYNGTKVIIEHDGFLTKESLEMHDKGWDSYFEKLQKKILNDY